MDTKTAFDEILKAREEKIAAENAEAKSAQQQAADALVKEMKTAFGSDIWEIFSAAATPRYSSSRRDIEITMEIPALDEYQLAPIDISWNRYSGSGTYNNYPFSVWGNSCKTLEDALARAREAYPKYKAREKENAIKEQKDILHHWTGTKDEAQAVAAYEKLVEIDPANQGEWKEFLTHWKTLRAEEAFRALENKREVMEREEGARVYQELRQQYIDQLVIWLKDLESVITKNQDLAEVIQEKHNVPYEVGRLVYGVSATDEDTSERVVETRQVYVLGTSDHDGYWWNGDKFIKYFNLVSHEKTDVIATDDILSRKFSKGGVTLYFHPDLPKEYIEGVTQEIAPLPKRPEAPSELNYYDSSENCLQAARNIISKENGEPVEGGDRWEDF